MKKIFLTMKKKGKRVAVHAELRKESIKFDGYLKYEITILNEDGSIEKVPAYGKDLQDALSRVVHDERVEQLESRIVNKLPDVGWVVAWFLGFALITSILYYNVQSKYVGFYLIGAIGLYALLTLSITNWFSLRNKI